MGAKEELAIERFKNARLRDEVQKLKEQLVIAKSVAAHIADAAIEFEGLKNRFKGKTPR